MSYTNPFNATIMPGSTQAKLIDDFSRQMYAALIERLNDKFVVDATADPWVLLATVSGAKANKLLAIPFNHFTTLGGGSTVIALTGVTSNGAANALLAGFSLPVGVTITLATIYLTCTSQVNLELYKITGSAPFTKVSIAAWSQAASGQIASNNGTPLIEVTDGTAAYFLSVDLVSSSSSEFVTVYGARITYTTPSHLNTI